MEINGATMVKVVQHYLDTVLLSEGHNLKVRSVRPVNNYAFRIELSEKEEGDDD
jgi:hypothetical protein